MRNLSPEHAADQEVASVCSEVDQVGEWPASADGTPADHGDCGTASFAACSRLFSGYPLAVMQGCAGGQDRAMVLMKRAAGAVAFFALSQDRDDLFVVRSLRAHDRTSHEIRPGGQVPDVICRLLADGMPVPRDRALLGWVTDRQVTAMLAVRTGLSETREVPEIRVMPMSRTSELDWPPFTASPLCDGRLWDYVERGQLVDIVPLLTRSTGHAFWVPSPYGRSAGYIVVSGNLPTDEYWLPAGVYMDHWWLREGIQAPPAGQLLALPGAVDLACGAWRRA